MSNELTTTLNPSQLTIFTQETPKEQIRTRPGRGGRVLLYTDGAFVIRTLNEAFGWHWDFEVDHEEILYIGDRPFETRCRGRLIVWFGTQSVTKMQYGCQQIELLKDGSAPVSLGDAFKGAATDALKKCASMLGIALDLYDSDSEVNTQNPQQIQREIQQAKQQVKQVPVVVEQPKTNGKPSHPPTATASPNKPSSTVAERAEELTQAVNTQLGQPYYNAPAHVHNALKKYLGVFSWPALQDEAGWKSTTESALVYAREQILLDLAIKEGEAHDSTFS